MLTISPAQYAALSDDAERGYERRLRARWAKRFPKHVARLSEAQQHALAGHGLRRAQARGFIYEADTMRFTDLMLLLGPRFDDPERGAPWALAILDDPDAALPAKLAKLREGARRRAGAAPR